MSQRNFRAELTERGFAQDALNALGSDVVNGLIELVTNADDAYRGRQGQIRIVRSKTSIHPDYRDSISVFDSALGMSEEDLEIKLTKLGGINNEFMQGLPVRGALGRGAKDCAAFGAVWFRTIKDGRYSELLLRDTGNGVIESSRAATSQDYEILGLNLGESGLCASMMFKEQTRSKIPSDQNLIFRLSNEAQLRGIIQSQRVTYESLEGSRRHVILEISSAPILKSLVSLTGSVPGFSSSEFTFTLSQLTSPGDLPFGSCSVQGILVTGEKAIYENTLFGFEAIPEGRFIKGELECLAIDRLLREYDTSGPTEQNNTRIVRRDRSGLDKQHPFVNALFGIVRQALSAAVEEIRSSRGSQQSEGNELRKRLDVLKRSLKAEIQNLLDEEEGSQGHGENPHLHVIPAAVKVERGRAFSLSLVSPKPNELEEPEVRFEASVIQIDSNSSWRGRLNLDQSIRSFRFICDTPGIHQVHFQLGGESCRAVVQVVESSGEVTPDYSKLHFTPDKASVKPGGARNLRIVGPSEMAEVKVNIVEGSASCPSSIEMLPSADGLGTFGTVRLEVPLEIQSIKVHALDEPSGMEADCNIEVTRRQSAPGEEFDFTVRNDLMGGFRCAIEPGNPKIVVAYGKHPANQSSLGSYDESNSSFVNENSSASVRMLAELYASTLAGHIVERNAANRPDDYSDATQVLFRHAEIANRLVVLCLNALNVDRDS